MITPRQFPPVFFLDTHETMRHVILRQEIVEVPTVAVFARRENAKPGKLVIPLQSLPPHDESVHDRLADSGQFGESACGTSPPARAAIRPPPISPAH